MIYPDIMASFNHVMMPMFRTICYSLTLFLLWGWISAGYAAQPVDFGSLAQGLLEPVSVVLDFISTVSMVIGGTCLFAAFIKYLEYRVNPLASPISMVIFLIIFGIMLLLLPLTYKLMENGLALHLHG